MSYKSSLDFLNGLVNYESHSFYSPKWNLDRMRFLLRLAGRPDESFIPVVIVGTKGKGSTGYFLESILNSSGVSAGFYSSPHLQDPRERIRLCGKMISEKLWAQGLSNIKRLLSSRPLPSHLGKVTYFEVLTLLAALVFRDQKIKVGIFEAGMGGRYDAVNALEHRLAVITPIHLDHQAVLGNTIAKIAAEKAAVIRSQEPVVVSPQVKEAWAVINKEAAGKRAEIFPVRGNEALFDGNTVGLAGDYQQTNASAAFRAAEQLKNQFGVPVTKAGATSGIRAGNWPGRFEVLRCRRRRWVLDSAHNPISIEALVRNLRSFYPKGNRVLVFGTSRDKDSALMLKTLSGYFSQVILTQAESSRVAEVPVLIEQARGHFERIYPSGNVSEALQLAEQLSSSGALIVVSGSFFVVGEARTFLQRNS